MSRIGSQNFSVSVVAKRDGKRVPINLNVLARSRTDAERISRRLVLTSDETISDVVSAKAREPETYR